jgi:hypothetical protein
MKFHHASIRRPLLSDNFKLLGLQIKILTGGLWQSSVTQLVLSLHEALGSIPSTRNIKDIYKARLPTCSFALGLEVKE